MADRYWIGGGGNWNDTAHWSTSSGGSGGAAKPTSSDNVIVDASSGTAPFTIQIDIGEGGGSGGMMNDLTFNHTGAVMIGGSSLGSMGGTLNIYGNLLLRAANVINSIARFCATGTGKTITTNGVAMTETHFDDAGGGWTLQDNYDCGTFTAKDVRLNRGHLNLNGYMLRCGNFHMNYSAVKTLTMGAGTISQTWTGGVISTTGTTTMNMGTGTWICKYLTSLDFPTGLNPYNIQVENGTTISMDAISGTLSYGSFSPQVGHNYIWLARSMSIGTLQVNGSGDLNRTMLISNILGTRRTLTVTTWTSPAYIDFADIGIAGAAAGSSPTRAGDYGNNTGMNFPSATTVYWNSTSNTTWFSNSWTNTPGGSVNTSYFPLPQDTAIIGSNTPSSLSISTVRVGNIDCSGLTNAMDLNIGAAYIYGNFALSTSITLTTATSAYGLYFMKNSGTQNINMAGRTIPADTIYFGYFSSTATTTWNLTGALSCTESVPAAISMYAGTINFNSHSHTIGTFSFNSTSAKAINLNTCTLTVINGTQPFPSASNLTFDAGTSTVKFKRTGSAASFNINASGINFYNVDFDFAVAGSTIYFNNACTFNNITDSGAEGFTIQFASGGLYVMNAIQLTGASGKLITVTTNSSGNATLRKATDWNMGTNSTNGSNNVGLSFTSDGTMDWLSVSKITGQNSLKMGNNIFMGNNF